MIATTVFVLTFQPDWRSHAVIRGESSRRYRAKNRYRIAALSACRRTARSDTSPPRHARTLPIISPEPKGGW